MTMTDGLPPSPDQLLGDLFNDVQLSGIFTDSKTFVDCISRMPPDQLLALYDIEKSKPSFDLSAFVHEHFTLPDAVLSDYVSDTSISTAEHINRLWDRLTRPADVTVGNGPAPAGAPVRYQSHGDSRVPLPHPYVVPGGRFREIFYWDSYFTLLGLRESGQVDLIRGMLDNFAHLIDRFGFIPNGNRTYFLSRSQPPFFALMVQLLADIDGDSVFVKYGRQLQQEYRFWMNSFYEVLDGPSVDKRVVNRTDRRILNRYWDNTPLPRPEAYRQEIELTEEAEWLGVAPETLYTHIRAACESGWDFSSRWFADQKTMATIHTADIVPVDLNCLLYGLETALHNPAIQKAEWKMDYYDFLIKNRERSIQQTFWNEETGFFHDYDMVKGHQTEVLTLAGVFPLFFNLATPQQAQRVHDRLKADFLQAGGWVTTLNQTGEQWDWPNGWAPLQWMVYSGLTNYGFTETAREGRDRWLALNDKVFKATGKLMEKYNVVDAALTTGGGEYENQDGFGWTNGVYLCLLANKTNEGTNKNK